jgi:hypothetical protein
MTIQRLTHQKTKNGAITLHDAQQPTPEKPSPQEQTLLMKNGGQQQDMEMIYSSFLSALSGGFAYSHQSTRPKCFRHNSVFGINWLNMFVTWTLQADGMIFATRPWPPVIAVYPAVLSFNTNLLACLPGVSGSCGFAIGVEASVVFDGKHWQPLHGDYRSIQISKYSVGALNRLDHSNDFIGSSPSMLDHDSKGEQGRIVDLPWNCCAKKKGNLYLLLGHHVKKQWKIRGRIRHHH